MVETLVQRLTLHHGSFKILVVSENRPGLAVVGVKQRRN